MLPPNKEIKQELWDCNYTQRCPTSVTPLLEKRIASPHPECQEWHDEDKDAHLESQSEGISFWSLPCHPNWQESLGNTVPWPQDQLQLSLPQRVPSLPALT